MAKKTAQQKAGIFCLETAAWDEETWDKEVEDPDSFSQDSYDHFLRFLETSITDTGGIPYRHFDVATKEEFEVYLKKWKRWNIQKHFPVLLLAFHGDREGFSVIENQDRFVAEQLVEYLKDEDLMYDNAIIHFSSCYFTEPEKMEKLLYETGALSVSGYMNKDGVGWYEAVAFELLYLTKLFSADPPKKKAGPPKKTSEMREIGKCFADGNEGGMKTLSDSLRFHMWYRVDKADPNAGSDPDNVHAVLRKDLAKKYGADQE